MLLKYKNIMISGILLSSLGFSACGKTKSSASGQETEFCCEVKTPQNATIKNTPLTKESIYQLNESWDDKNNQKVKLMELQGQVQIVAMIFTNCAYACPRIVADLKKIESEIPSTIKSKVDFLLLSFDDVRDTPAVLNQYAKDQKLGSRWRLLHGNENQIREISMVLGVKYDKMADNSFAHSNLITVLNQKGEIAYQQEGLGVKSDLAVKKILELTESSK